MDLDIEVQKIRGDGNCMWRAIAFALNHLDGKKYDYDTNDTTNGIIYRPECHTYQTIKDTILDYEDLKKESGDFWYAMFITNESEPSAEDTAKKHLIETLKQDKTPVSLEGFLLIIEKKYNITLKCIQKLLDGSRARLIIDNTNENERLVLLYHVDNDHYNLLVVNQDEVKTLKAQEEIWKEIEGIQKRIKTSKDKDAKDKDAEYYEVEIRELEQKIEDLKLQLQSNKDQLSMTLKKNEGCSWPRRTIAISNKDQLSMTLKKNEGCSWPRRTIAIGVTTVLLTALSLQFIVIPLTIQYLASSFMCIELARALALTLCVAVSYKISKYFFSPAEEQTTSPSVNL